jgi:hypothetical protein
MTSTLRLSAFRWPTAILFLCSSLLFIAAARGDDRPGDSGHWYKGNTHAHSFWSDGDEFPEMVADWYKSHGYDFLALSDHDRLMEGEKWMVIGRPTEHEKRFVPTSVLEKCGKRFGQDWLEVRSSGDVRQVKLKTLDQIRAKLAEPGKFLLIQNEEISARFGDHNVHMNAINLAERIMPRTGKDVVDTLSLNLASAAEQAERLRRPIVVHVNHPNWSDYDISPEDLAASTAKFFEVCNGGGGVRNCGDAAHPSVEKLWDVANTIRIAGMKAPPLYGVGSDDVHNYHHFAPDQSNPGRAWIVVRAKQLSADALLDAVNRGDFYASTGVMLRNVAYDPQQRTLSVEVRPEAGVRYTIQFIGTLAGADTAVEVTPMPTAVGQKPARAGRKYSPEIGKILASVEGESASYKLTGKELYVRAVVRSDKPIPNACTSQSPMQEAWCQPVGWEK